MRCQAGGAACVTTATALQSDNCIELRWHSKPSSWPIFCPGHAVRHRSPVKVRNHQASTQPSFNEFPLFCVEALECYFAWLEYTQASH